MDNKLSIITEKRVLGKEFKIYGTAEEPLFLAKDVATWIGYSISNVSKLVNVVDEEEKVRNIITTLGGNQETWFLTEDGLYEVLMQSRKPIAKAFKKEVKLILKDIRKNGMYVNSNLLDDMLENPEFSITMLQKLKVEKENQKTLTKAIEEQKPKVVFADAVTISSSTILVGELAKLIKQNGVDIGQNRLFQWLRDNGYLIKKKGLDYNMPTQKSMELELFKVKETIITKNNGENTINKTTKVTGKGQIYFINKFINETPIYMRS
ncbi:phage antirepressor [Clostridium tertium]